MVIKMSLLTFERIIFLEQENGRNQTVSCKKKIMSTNGDSRKKS